MANFAPGGISGLALMGNYLWGFPIGITTLLLNIPLVFISYRFVGKKFLIKTARTMIFCTVFLDFVFPFCVFLFCSSSFCHSFLLLYIFYQLISSFYSFIRLFCQFHQSESSFPTIHAFPPDSQTGCSCVWPGGSGSYTAACSVWPPRS